MKTKKPKPEINIKWCDHIEYAERTRGEFDGSSFSYGFHWWIVGKTHMILKWWNFCPICAAPRPKLKVIVCEEKA